MASRRTEPLIEEDGPLVWIDCEMTGLDPKADVLLEIAVIITDGQLEPVDDGIEFIISTPKSVLDNMNQWCVDQHGKSGLTAACIAEPREHDVAWVEQRVLEYVKRWVPSRGVGVLAGNTVHFDKVFLSIGMKNLVEHLHYRIVDVSSIKELVKRWYPQRNIDKATSGESKHRALDDIQWSIKELQYYRENVFVRGP
ncbi:ribonuclease H-like protein [Auriculariales sp. MPI-PUGE-AT-0066]|nr:ribonuclease H-like protein [Auriculariales sp. MPI-PUGE-AT-0066]